MPRKVVGFRLSPEKRTEIMVYCAKHNTSIQRLLEEYIDMILIAEEKGLDFPTLAKELFREKVEGSHPE